jgi:hypothetical protein
MAIANYFYNQTTRKYVALFGTLFNQLKIQRDKNDGTTVQEMIVPLSYAPMQKILARVQQDRDLLNSTKPAIVLPRMSFEITNMTYDSARKISTTRKIIKQRKDETEAARNYVYSGVPYNLDFSLYIMTSYSEDAVKLLEQIIPFFTPDWTVAAKMIPDLDPLDIPVILNGITTEEIYEGGFEDRPTILYTLTFTLKGWYFGPEKLKKVIKFIDINLHADTAADAAIIEGIDIQPGLDSDGNPVTILGSNATADAEINTNGVVTTVTVRDTGEGYNSNTTVTFSEPDTANAEINATITSGSVTALNIVTGGGAFNTPPVLTVSNPDVPVTTATAVSTLSGGAIDDITITNAGTYYNAPTVTVATPPIAAQIKFGTNALAHTPTDKLPMYTFPAPFGPSYKMEFWIYPTATTAQYVSLVHSAFAKLYMEPATGKLWWSQSSLPLVNSDTLSLNFDAWNHVVFEHVNSEVRFSINGYRHIAQTTASSNIASRNTTIKIGAALANESTFDSASESFIGFVDNFTLDVITAFDGSDSASYTIPTAPITGSVITKDFDFVQATANAVITEGEVTGITITNAGSGYETAPVVTVDDPDDIPATFAATATATITNGTISGVTINNAGKFYTAATVTAAVPPSVTATGTANVLPSGDVRSITLTDAGLGYRTAPTVTISNAPQASIPYQDIEFDDNWGLITTIVDE